MMSLLMIFSLSSCTDQGSKKVLGNTSGNVNNGARFVTLGDSVYFTIASSDQGFDNPNAGFYKTDLNGLKIEKLFSNDLGSLFISGDVIVSSAGYDFDPSTGKLSLSSWAKEIEAGSSFLVYGDLVVLSNKNDQDKLYSIYRDGTKLTKLTEVSVSKVDLSSGWIFYTTQAPETLRRMKLNGKSDALVSEDAGSDFIIVEDMIYYSSLSHDHKLYEMNLNGTLPKLKLDIVVKNLNMSLDRVYFVKPEDGRIYSIIKDDGVLPSARSMNSSDRLNFAGDFIFFEDSYTPNTIHKIHNKGSQSSFITSTDELGYGLGNTSGNINNGAIMVEAQGWTFISEPATLENEYPFSRINPYGGLWRMRTDTAEREQISKEDVGTLFAVGNLIYTQSGYVYNLIDETYKEAAWATASRHNLIGAFIVYDDKIIKTNPGYATLTIINVNGYVIKELPEQNDVNERINAIDGWIYYIHNADSEYRLYKVRFDGTNRTVVASGVNFDYVIDNNVLYYKNINDWNKLYSKDLETGVETKLSDVEVMSINSTSTKVSYVSLVDYYVYEVDKDGKNTKKISSTTTINNWILGDYLYTRDNHLYNNLNRLSLSTLKTEELFGNILKINPVSNPADLLKGNGVSSFEFEKDGWIYTTTGKGIYKMKTDGTSKTKISEINAHKMVVISDWIYFINYDHLNWIYRMKLDGSEVGLVSNHPSSHFIVKDEWIYFEAYTLDRVRTDGTGYTNLAYSLSGDINPPFFIENNKIIYQVRLDDYFTQIMRCDLDGKNNAKLLQGINYLFNVENGWIYYDVHDFSGMDPHTIYRIDFSGQHKTRMIDESRIDVIGTYDSWVYVYGRNRTAIIRMKADGSQSSVIITIPDGNIENTLIINSKLIISAMDYIDVIKRIYISDLDGTNFLPVLY